MFVAPTEDDAQTVQSLKRLIWLYFWLWIFEGALRKWILPSLANPLLIVRDPVVLAIYWTAARRQMFPRNNFLAFSGALGAVSLVAGILVLGNIGIALYGYRTNFLYLPLVFIIAQTFDADDVKKMGRAVLITAIPMALLMALQFRAPANSFLVSGADANFGQLESAAGHIRAPGTFSFILGPVCFFPLVAAFLLDSAISLRRYPVGLLISSAIALGIAIAVSGSRSLLSSVLIVAAFAAVAGCLLRPRWIPRILATVVAALLLSTLLGQVDVFNAGNDVFSARIESASGSEGGVGGFVARFADGILEPFNTLNDIPLQGFGLGYGTNAAAGLLSGDGKRVFLLSEGEWGRILLESGPVLGLFFIIFRVYLSLLTLRVGAKCIFTGNLLTLLLAASCFLSVLNGQWGVPTMMGYSIFCCGFCLASAKETETEREAASD